MGTGVEARPIRVSRKGTKRGVEISAGSATTDKARARILLTIICEALEKSSQRDQDSFTPTGHTGCTTSYSDTILHDCAPHGRYDVTYLQGQSYRVERTVVRDTARHPLSRAFPCTRGIGLAERTMN